MFILKSVCLDSIHFLYLLGWHLTIPKSPELWFTYLHVGTKNSTPLILFSCDMVNGQGEIIHMKPLPQCLAYRKKLNVFIIVNGAYNQKAKCAAHISITALLVLYLKKVCPCQGHKFFMVSWFLAQFLPYIMCSINLWWINIEWNEWKWEKFKLNNLLKVT